MCGFRMGARGLLLVVLWGVAWAGAWAQRVVHVPMRSEVSAASWHMLRQAFHFAGQEGADLILLSINTYGGAVDMADSMRTLILNSRVPVWAYVDNQAASAGALIALACDSIYMRRGASMGAATVVGGQGQAMPDKYQSFMRSMMRSTAQAKGRVVQVDGAGDTTYRYRRSPELAEAMVDPDLAVPGVVDSGHVLTMTTEEAIALGMCEGMFDSKEELLAYAGYGQAQLVEYTPKPIDRMKGFLLSPVVSGILIMLIVGGIYFELQTPGVGFPLVVAIAAAVAYFAPLYIDGLAQNLDLILFLAGLVLLALEVFVVPGFGVTGISGIALVVIGLSLALVDNSELLSAGSGAVVYLLRAVALVLVSLTVGFVASVALGAKLITSARMPIFSLRKSLLAEEGYVGVSVRGTALVGKEGVTLTVLRPSGKVWVEGQSYDALSEGGMLEKGTRVRVVRVETNQVYVLPLE